MGKRLLQLPQKRTELAQKLGVHPMTISRWERDFVKIPNPAAIALELLVAMRRRKKRGK
jgi:transcriptional regulator with XRE-family HTH domain